MVNAQVAALKAAVNKAVGDDVLQLASDEKFVTKYIPTGVMPMDILLRGGFPRGRFTMLQGDWSTLKSYACYCAIRETQREGGVAGLVDTEHAFDRDWAEELGINVDDLIVVRGESAEQALDACEGMVRGGIDFLGFDSVAAGLPQQEGEKRLYKENVQPGRQAALYSLASRKLTTANTGRTAMVWIAQLRENIGITFGPREKATGGRALPFYSSYIIDIRKVGKISVDEKMFTGDKWQNTKVQVGQRYKAELIKSKLNKPFRDVWFDWSLTTGTIDIISFMFTQGLELNLITQKGSSYTCFGKKVVGKDKFKAALLKDEKLQARLSVAIYKAHGMEPLSSVLALSDARNPKPTGAAKAKKSLGAKKTLRKVS